MLDVTCLDHTVNVSAYSHSCMNHNGESTEETKLLNSHNPQLGIYTLRGEARTRGRTCPLSFYFTESPFSTIFFLINRTKRLSPLCIISARHLLSFRTMHLTAVNLKKRTNKPMVLHLSLMENVRASSLPNVSTDESVQCLCVHM